GGSDPRVPALRERLAISGDLESGGEGGPVYDPALVAAVERFQARHGLAVDGVVGPRTLRALNVSAEARVAQLERSWLERLALERQLGERYVLVNVPAFELVYAEDGEMRQRTNVVVGDTRYQTPIFADAIDHLVFNPSWSVPSSIANRSLLDDFREDPARMEEEGYHLIGAGGRSVRPTEVDWSSVERGAIPYRVRQRPGSANALGVVKFMFPNEHAVYLHDTPSKSLFRRAMRASSNGCVRVENPLDLATLLLASDGWTRAEIDDLVASGRQRTVSLSRPVPVHLVYLTAWTETDGVTHFRDDVYGREVPPVEVASR
ncbi:MAG: L,D-transpeptidase family protein, partial [Pseudomonadota bacterium]